MFSRISVASLDLRSTAIVFVIQLCVDAHIFRPKYPCNVLLWLKVLVVRLHADERASSM
jgi:hypothetical protein